MVLSTLRHSGDNKSGGSQLGPMQELRTKISVDINNSAIFIKISANVQGLQQVGDSIPSAQPLN